MTSPSLPLSGLATAVLGLTSILFPFLVLFAADDVGIWPLIALLACAAALRLFLVASGEGLGAVLTAQAGAVGVIAGLGLFNADLAARLYPVAVNGAMLFVFAGSLFSPTPIIERLARLTDPSLPPSGVAYCRGVTKVWCTFFVLNGAIALATALWADRDVWAIYNGAIAYIMIGCLFAVEYAVRTRVQRRHARKDAP